MSGVDELAGQSGATIRAGYGSGATDGVASFILPQVLRCHSARSPELELQIVALPRVINLSKREADMAITVSPPQTGRITVQKITDYHLHLAAAHSYLHRPHPWTVWRDLRNHPVVGYIQDMISYPELDFLEDLGVEKTALASNLVSVQLGLVKQGGGNRGYA